MKVTCALKWARKLPRKTETYESAKCVPCNTRKCTHNGFVPSGEERGETDVFAGYYYRKLVMHFINALIYN